MLAREDHKNTSCSKQSRLGQSAPRVSPETKTNPSFSKDLLQSLAFEKLRGVTDRFESRKMAERQRLSSPGAATAALPLLQRSATAQVVQHRDGDLTRMGLVPRLRRSSKDSEISH
jgi:hypothetical protein